MSKLGKGRKWPAVIHVGVATCLVSMPLLATQHIQTVIDNGSGGVGPSDPMDSYDIKNNSHFWVRNGVVGRIFAQDSWVNISQGSHIKNGVIGSGSGTLLISDSKVESSAYIGLILQRGHEAFIKDSTIVGWLAGVSANSSYVELDNVRVVGTYKPGWGGWALGNFGSTVEVKRGSYLTGDDYGAYISHSEFFGELPPGFDQGYLSVDDSTLHGVEGAAIRVEGRDGHTITASIDILNNSTLISGNGNLLESHNQSTTHFNVDNSVLTGNLVADNTSTLNVSLKNNARLTGAIVNGNRLVMHSGGYWQMTGDSDIKSLIMDGGTVSLGDAGFNTLSLNQLAGQGTFSLWVDLVHGVGDLLDVQGKADGEHRLHVRNTGIEAVSPDLQPLRVVKTQGGDAQFSLIGGQVDLGVYSYLLEQQGNDWFIVGNGKTISPSTASALALFNAGPNIWMSELSTLRSRMGEVRGTGLGGGWIRAYGNRFEATTSDGVDYQQKQQGFSLGADAPVPVSNGQLSLGVLAGHSQSDLDLSRGTSGTVDSVYVGTYATWLSEQGYYVDAVLKLNRLRNKAKVAMSDHTKAKGDYDSTGIGASVEFGRHITLADDWFVEPYAQLAAVTLQGERYRIDNGLQASNSHTRSVLGKVGGTLGRDIPLKDGGVVQPYLRVAVAQEFSRSNEVKVNDSKFDNNLFGSRAEVGAGVSVSLSERLQLHADLDYMNGKRVEQPWGANVGLRFAF